MTTAAESAINRRRCWARWLHSRGVSVPDIARVLDADAEDIARDIASPYRRVRPPVKPSSTVQPGTVPKLRALWDLGYDVATIARVLLIDVERARKYLDRQARQAELDQARKDRQARQAEFDQARKDRQARQAELDQARKDRQASLDAWGARSVDFEPPATPADEAQLEGPVEFEGPATHDADPWAYPARWGPQCERQEVRRDRRAYPARLGPRYKRRLTPAQIDEIPILHAQGMTAADIARRWCVSVGTIRRRARPVDAIRPHAFPGRRRRRTKVKPVRRRVRLTEDLVEEVVRMRREGESWEAIARRLGVDDCTLWAWRRSGRLPVPIATRERRLGDAELDDIARLRAAGWTWSDLARRYEVSGGLLWHLRKTGRIAELPAAGSWTGSAFY